jgi:hypothetical protein
MRELENASKDGDIASFNAAVDSILGDASTNWPAIVIITA